MYTQAAKHRSTDDTVRQHLNHNKPTVQFVDNRLEATVQRKIQTMADHNPQVLQLRAFQTMANEADARERQPIQRETGQFRQIADQMGQQYKVDTSAVACHTNSDFPRTVGAVATIQGKDIHFGPGQDTTENIKHEVGHFIDNTLHGMPKGDTTINGLAVDTTREAAADKIAATPLQRKLDIETGSGENINNGFQLGASKSAPLQRSKWGVVRKLKGKIPNPSGPNSPVKDGTEELADESTMFPAKVRKNPNVIKLLPGQNETTVHVYKKVPQVNKESPSDQTLNVGQQIFIGSPIKGWVPYSLNDKKWNLEGYIYINNILCEDAKYNQIIAKSEQNKREDAIRNETGSDLVTLRELKAHYNMLMYGDASTEIDGGVFWSGDTFEGAPLSRPGKYQTYKYDSMLSGHEWARAFHFKSLEMTEGGYSAESHLLFQPLNDQIKKLKALINWKTLEQLQSFPGAKVEEQTNKDGTSGPLQPELKGFGPGRWWDGISTRFAEQQRGLVWCIHASTFDNYWSTTLELVKKGINVTWFNKEYPSLCKKLTGNLEDLTQIHGIVEIYNDKVTVSTSEFHEEPNQKQKPSKFFNFTSLQDFLSSDLLTKLARDRADKIKKENEFCTKRKKECERISPESPRSGQRKGGIVKGANKSVWQNVCTSRY